MAGHHFTVSRSKSRNQIHRVKKWVLLSERRGRSACTDPGWRKIVVLFANKIPPQTWLLSHYPVTLQVGPGGCFPPRFGVKDVQETKGLAKLCVAPRDAMNQKQKQCGAGRRETAGNLRTWAASERWQVEGITERIYCPWPGWATWLREAPSDGGDVTSAGRCIDCFTNLFLPPSQSITERDSLQKYLQMLKDQMKSAGAAGHASLKAEVEG